MKSYDKNFIETAGNFAVRNRSGLLFRVMRSYLRCDADQLDFVIKKIYCNSIPENTYVGPESPLRAALILLALPCYLLLKKKCLWRKCKPVDYNFETIDEPYFNRWFRKLYEELKGTKRITPRAPRSFSKEAVTDKIDSTVTLRDLGLLFMTSPLLCLATFRLSRKYKLNFFSAVRRALYGYAVFQGYFSRYPCRDFVTYSDETNHPCRYIAFKQNCGGELIVIQNGERIFHPLFAFGMMDRYYVFGKTTAQILKNLKVHSKSFKPVGALCLNEHFEAINKEKQSAQKEILHDILFLDQCFYPFNGFNERSALSIHKILINLNLYKRHRPACRIAYQLRNYGSDRKVKLVVLETLRRIFTEEIEILDHAGCDGNIDSYRNILRSNLVMTFESTLGFEAMRLGKKVLFVNYSGDPAESLCTDARFQIVDENADYGLFEERVTELLGFELKEIPQVALERHSAFDGKVQERLAGLLNNGRS